MTLKTLLKTQPVIYLIKKIANLVNKCPHLEARETNYTRQFTIDKVTGLIPLWECTKCGDKVFKPIK